MIKQKPKQILAAVAVLLFLSFTVISCTNSADTSKAGTDSSKMSAPPAAVDTTKKVDTTKMDTAATRPVKVTS